MPAPSRLLASAAIGALILIWGTTWAGIRIGLEGIPPWTGVALRFAIASLVLLTVARALRLPVLGDRRARILGLVNGLFSFCISYGVVYWAEQWIPSGLAAVLFSTFPFFVAALAHFWLPGERFTLWAGIGTILGFAGVAVIFSEDLLTLAGPKVLTATLVFLISPFVSAVAHVAIKRWGQGVHPFALTALPMALTAGVMGMMAAVFERGRPVVFDGTSVGALLYLSVMGSAVTFTLYFWLLSHLPATRLSLITYGVPVVAVVVGALALDEPYTPRMLLGSMLVIIGVAAAARRR